MVKQKKQTTFKSLGVSREEAENIRAALKLLEETEEQEERDALRKSQERARKEASEYGFRRGVRRLVILYKNYEQYPHEEKEFKWYQQYDQLLDQLEGAFGKNRVKEQFDQDYPKYNGGEDLQHGRLK